MLGINIAQPCNRQSHVYILPSTESINEEVNAGKRKYVIIKMIEFVFTIIGLVLFTLGVAATESTLRDILTCVSFGAFLIYPFIFTMLCLGVKNRINLITFNAGITLLLLLVASMIVSSLWHIQSALDVVEIQKPELFLKGEFSANMKLFSALSCFVNAVIYMSETILLIVETKGYI